jgi:hypothetical protein
MTEKKTQETEQQKLERRFLAATGSERERLRRQLERLGSRKGAETR